MSESNRQESLKFRFYDVQDREDVNTIYIDEENPASISLRFEIQNNSGVDLELKPYRSKNNQNTPDPKDKTNSNIHLPVGSDNFHLELRFRPGTLSTASLVQLDLAESSKDRWKMSRPVFHENREVSLYFLRYNEPLKLSTPRLEKDSSSTSTKESLTLRGFAANSTGGARVTNVIIQYRQFYQPDDTFEISSTQSLVLTILTHRGQRKAPFALSFASHNSILNNGETDNGKSGKNGQNHNNLKLQVTNIGRDAIALSPQSEFIIEIDAQAEGRQEPWAVAKKDEAGNFNAEIFLYAKETRGKDAAKFWYWKAEFSGVDKNVEEPKFTFRNISRQLGSQKVIKSVMKREQQYIEIPKQLEQKVICLTSDRKKSIVAFPGTSLATTSGYSLDFQEDGNLVIYKIDRDNLSKEPIWATGTYRKELKADILTFQPNGNLVLLKEGKPVWSTRTCQTGQQPLILKLEEDGNLVIAESIEENSKRLFEAIPKEKGESDLLNESLEWQKLEAQNQDENIKPDRQIELNAQGSTSPIQDYSFPSNEDLIFELSNIKSSLDSGQGQIRVYYRNIPGYADGSEIITVYKTQLIERNKKIGIGKFPNTELDVLGKVSASEVDVTGKVSAASFVGMGAVVKGMIVMWSGSETDIPEGWRLCNGEEYKSYQVPDLRDRFIVCAGDKHELNQSGEPDTHHHAIDPPKTECSTNYAGEHSHQFPKNWSHSDFANFGGFYGGNHSLGIDTCGEKLKHCTTQSSGGHSHDFSFKTPEFYSKNSSSENRPRWYALCFIIYVG